jgi:hypothetical protein
MQRIFDRPKVTYVVLVVAMVGLFALSAVGQSDGSSLAWIGATGWFGFMLAVLLTIVYSVALVVRSLRRRRTTA